MKRRKRKKKIIEYILAGFFGIYVVVAVVIAGINKPNVEIKPEEEPKVEQPAKKPNYVLEIPEEEKAIQITISAAGDCTLGTDKNFNRNTSFVAMYNEKKNPAYFLEKVQSVFAKDDLTIVNLEGTFTTSNSRQDKQYAFKGDPEYTAILTEGSVEAVNLANNHSRDYGMQSLADTKKYLDEAGVVHFGYEETAIVECKGVKIGLVGIYELPDGLGRLQQVKDNIKKVKDEGATLVIVSFHWGIEREYYPESIQKKLAHTAIDEGADLVLGHHPHVLQGIETYKGKKIAYSLGNFCFGGNSNPSDKDTMIFQQTFTIKDGEVMLDENVNIIPCSLSSVSHRNNYQPKILKGDEAKRVLKKIEKFSKGL